MQGSENGANGFGTLNLGPDDIDIFNDFITESRDSIEEIEPLLIKLEEDISGLENVDSDLINKIFRVFHSIKGSAGFIGLKITSEVTHHAETLLDLVRKGKTQLTPGHIDIFLELCDFFQSLFNQMQESYSEDGFGEAAGDFVSRLEDLISGPEKEKATPAKKKKSSPKAGSNKSKKSVKANKEQEPAPQNSDELISPELIDQFVQDTRVLLESLEQDLLELEKNPREMELAKSAFRSLHSLKGNAGFFGFKDINLICHRAETFLDEVRNGVINATTDHFSLLLQVQDFIKTANENLAEGKSPDIDGREGLLTLMDDFLGEGEASEDAEPAGEPEPENSEKSTVEKTSQKIEGVQQEAPKKSGSGPGSNQKKVNEVIRVDVNKLNRLMDLVGEIVIAESMVSQHPEIMSQDLPGFEKSVIHLQKYIRELQELATGMRMIPLSGLFRKMIRLVRDLGSKSKKNVDLEISGGETEVDRSIIEQISDPLVHIIRNSVDHGLEQPEERKKSGKPETGSIVLEAKQIGGEIRITIKDDGRGLNREKILKKATEKGLVNGNADELTDEKVWQLIFMPGFSTADKVTDISGRGVGLDVVQRNIEKIRGKVDVESTPGKGSQFNLRIPLTTAIVDGMLIRVENSLYAIPMLDIKESVQVADKDVYRMVDGQEVVKIREQLFPVVRLHELHNIMTTRRSLSEGILVVVENGGKSLAIFTDSLIGQKQLVIKPLPHYVGNVQAVSGCAILGNGDTSLILDIASLIKISESSNQTKELANAG